MGLLDSLKEKALELAPTLLGDGSDIEVNLPAMTAILEDLDEILADGFQWDEFDDVFAEVVLPLFDLARGMKGKTGAEKKQFVLDAVCVIYFHINPDIPLIPESVFGIKIEDRVEKFFVPKVAGGMVEIAYKLYKKFAPEEILNEEQDLAESGSDSHEG